MAKQRWAEFRDLNSFIEERARSMRMANGGEFSSLDAASNLDTARGSKAVVAYLKAQRKQMRAEASQG